MRMSNFDSAALYGLIILTNITIMIHHCGGV